jgi:4-carboxymuconolactone decarboxylase
VVGRLPETGGRRDRFRKILEWVIGPVPAPAIIRHCTKLAACTSTIHRAHFLIISNQERTAMARATTASRDAIRDFTPKLIDLTEKVLFGDVWERPGLSKRDRSLITVATLVALSRTDQLKGHLRRALDNGVKKEEIVELITHLAFYSGWPTAMTAATVAKDILAEDG